MKKIVSSACLHLSIYTHQRQEKEAAERAAAVSHMSLGAAGVWGSAMSWASRASNAIPQPPPIHPSSHQVRNHPGSPHMLMVKMEELLSVLFIFKILKYY